MRETMNFQRKTHVPALVATIVAIIILIVCASCAGGGQRPSEPAVDTRRAEAYARNVGVALVGFRQARPAQLEDVANVFELVAGGFTFYAPDPQSYDLVSVLVHFGYEDQSWLAAAAAAQVALDELGWWGLVPAPGDDPGRGQSDVYLLAPAAREALGAAAKGLRGAAAMLPELDEGP